MISAAEWILIYLLPLLAGGMVAVATEKWLGRRFPLIVMVSTLSFSYLGNLLAQEWNVMDVPRDWFSLLSRAGFDFIWPKQAIGWVPLGLCWYVVLELCLGNGSGSKPSAIDHPIHHSQRQPCWMIGRGQLQRVTLLTVFVGVGFLILFLRMLWTSVYFTDRYSLRDQLLLVATPTLFIVAVASVSTFRLSCSETRWSMVGLFATLVLVLSASLLLATQGTVSLAKLSAAAGGALVVPMLFGPGLSIGKQRRGDASLSTRRPSYSAVILFSLLASWVPLLLGYLFAGVSLCSVSIAGISWLGLAVFWPDSTQSWYRKWGVTAMVLMPILVITAVSVYEFQSEVSASLGYGQYVAREVPVQVLTSSAEQLLRPPGGLSFAPKSEWPPVSL